MPEIEFLPLVLLEAKGMDARDFFQGQLTSDLRALREGHALPAAAADTQGRVWASFFLWQHGETLCLVTARELGAKALTRFSRYLLRSTVSLRLNEEMVFLGVWGEGAGDFLAALGAEPPHEPWEVKSFAQGWVIRPLGAKEHFLVAGHGLEQFLEKAKAPPPAWERILIEEGIAVVREETSEKFLPQMLDYDALGAVSYHKGCYLGQEVIARAHFRGEVKRGLCRLVVDAPIPRGARLLTSSGRPVDVVCAVPENGKTWALAVSASEAMAENEAQWHGQQVALLWQGWARHP